MAFAPEYVRLVLRENFVDAQALLLDPLIDIHEAHLVMLAETGLIAPPDAATLSIAVAGLDRDAIRTAVFDGAFEDLFYFVEHRLVEACGAETAGRLHMARSRNDIAMTMYRLCVRARLRRLADETISLRAALATLAARHIETLYPAHTHTQPAQPTTVAHYLLAVIEQLERDAARLLAADATTNACPLGACAITGTGFAIDRTRTSTLLGFDRPTGNTYGSIAAVDYLLESVGAVHIAVIGLGRVLQDLLLWSTREMGYLRIGDGFVQGSSIMPQKRNPVALEHARALASKAAAEAAAVSTVVHNTPFGDINDTEDDLQPLVARAFIDAERAIGLMCAALRDADFDVDRMRERASADWVTVTELADSLVRTVGVPFSLGHALAGDVIARVTADPALTPAAALHAAAAGRGLDVQVPAEIVSSWLTPAHFVAVRQTFGGPAPNVTRLALARAHEAIERDRARVTSRRVDAERASAERRAALAALRA